MKGLLFIYVITSMLVFFSCDVTDGWEGLKVLDSNRAEVEKKLGKPIREEDGVFWYETDEARFRVLYSDGPCVAPETVLGGYNVAKGTVLRYQVQLIKPQTIGELKVDLSSFKREDDPELLQFSHYYGIREGVSITALKMSEPLKEIVQYIYYDLTREQVAKYACKGK